MTLGSNQVVQPSTSRFHGLCWGEANPGGWKGRGHARLRGAATSRSHGPLPPCVSPRGRGASGPTHAPAVLCDALGLAAAGQEGGRRSAEQWRFPTRSRGSSWPVSTPAQQIFEVLMQESTCAQSQDGHERVTRTGEDNAKVGQGSADRGGDGE